jgi:hypothetical protein
MDESSFGYKIVASETGRASCEFMEMSAVPRVGKMLIRTQQRGEASQLPGDWLKDHRPQRPEQERSQPQIERHHED